MIARITAAVPCPARVAKPFPVTPLWPLIACTLNTGMPEPSHPTGCGYAPTSGNLARTPAR